MVRVSSFGQQQLLINGIFQNQSRVALAQQQVTTGKVTDEFRGLAGETGTALGTRSFLNRIETYQSSIRSVRGRVDANDVQIGGIINALEALRENMRTTLANNTAEGFSEILDTTFRFAVNALNTNLDGTFLFSGARTGTPPVNVANLAELQTATGVTTPTVSAGQVATVFDNAAVSFQARVADGVDLDFGLLAGDVAGEAFALIHNLYNYDQDGVTGPLQGELTAAQFSFLQTELQNLGTVIENIRQFEVQNGLVFERLDVVDEQHEDTTIFLQTFIADIEDVDIAEAITRLNNDQTALEASYRAVSTLNDLTLLRFL